MPIVPFIHSRFGNFSNPQAVRMGGHQAFTEDHYQEDGRLLIHLTVTGRCYARCEGCINSAITKGCSDLRDSVVTFEETNPERDTILIQRLADRHPGRTITLCFYGGEPFLAMDKMVRVWQLLRESAGSNKFQFFIYTSGEKIEEAFQSYPDFMKDIWTYSISIDGDESQNDRIRVGTSLRNIVHNLRCLSSFFMGNVLFWSTLRESQSLLNCFEEFMRLYQQNLVNHFFWHWAEDRQPIKDLDSFANRYGEELEKIMDVYVRKLDEGILLPLTHINELILYLLTGKKRGHTACGVEIAENYDIVSGNVYPCADLPADAVIGHLDSDGELKLEEYDLNSLVEYRSELRCVECGVYPYCGGRCPVQALIGSKDRTRQICQLMRLHVGIVQERLEDIHEALKKHNISLQDVYDRSAFLAKYTDVVP
ncbi:MAG: SPASM domain-containing protein [Candidatus Aminicenantes bacterium]|nr:SPASM domain-containing protein [Candidatus Aminicenantes bacterium]